MRQLAAALLEDEALDVVEVLEDVLLEDDDVDDEVPDEDVLDAEPDRESVR